MMFIRTVSNYSLCLVFFLSFSAAPVLAGDGVGRRNKISASYPDEKTITYYNQLIRDSFERRGITYSSIIKKTDPFLQEEKCVEKYRQYSIKSINFIKSEKSRHLFRVSCSGFDDCNRVVVTNIYTVSVSIPDNRVTDIKMVNR